MIIAEQVVAKHPWAKLQVIDEGQGIPENDLPYILSGFIKPTKRGHERRAVVRV